MARLLDLAIFQIVSFLKHKWIKWIGPSPIWLSKLLVSLWSCSTLLAIHIYVSICSQCFSTISQWRAIFYLGNFSMQDTTAVVSCIDRISVHDFWWEAEGPIRETHAPYNMVAYSTLKIGKIKMTLMIEKRCYLLPNQHVNHKKAKISRVLYISAKHDKFSSVIWMLGDSVLVEPGRMSCFWSIQYNNVFICLLHG